MSRMTIFGLVALVLLLGGCQSAAPTQPIPPVGMANPASVYCAGLGYQTQVRKDAQGNESGACVFPDGTECDEWAFFRAECGQDRSFCVKNGGKLEVRDTIPTCVFKDGSSCPEYDYFTGKCKPGG